MKYTLAAGIGGYTASAVIEAVAMVTCCHGNTHELLVHCARLNWLSECATPLVGLESKPVWQAM